MQDQEKRRSIIGMFSGRTGAIRDCTGEWRAVYGERRSVGDLETMRRPRTRAALYISILRDGFLGATSERSGRSGGLGGKRYAGHVDEVALFGDVKVNEEDIDLQFWAMGYIG
jgi:hypothetical protein